MRIETLEPLRLSLAIENRQSKIENRENRQSKIENRRGFTLVELLLVISIIALLVGLTASVVTKAYYAIKRANSERTVQRVHERILKRHQQLVKEAIAAEPLFDAFLLSGGTADRDRRRAKVIQLKLLQKWNFPMNYKEMWANVTITRDPNTNRDVITGHSTAVALYKTLLQRIQPGRVDSSGTPISNPSYGLPAALDPYTENAACLALIYEHLGSVGELTSSELQDTDGDGVNEICDAFGNPLRFYRWPTDFVDDITPVAGGGYVVDQLYNLPIGLVSANKLEEADDKANQDADDPAGVLYDFPVPPGQRWYERIVITPFGGQYAAVDIFEGRANSGNLFEQKWLKRMSFHRITRQRQDQIMSPQQRQPRAVYAPLVVVAAGIDKEFGLFRADRPEASATWQMPPYAGNYPIGGINAQYFDYWLRPDRMMIYNGVIPEADPGIANASYPLQRHREFDNLYSFRSRLSVEGQ